MKMDLALFAALESNKLTAALGRRTPLTREKIQTNTAATLKPVIMQGFKHSQGLLPDPANEQYPGPTLSVDRKDWAF
ncbi:hypothetical protein UY3_14887 [Chelonia mydas]|uniref:Uncharacterized protein n=1 Tax=Chelonia mydas TaxID=8469 RepID=M7ARP4_CHEMY|nr:hypothetical protein UY3_14887 [Chelonia mydas]